MSLFVLALSFQFVDAQADSNTKAGSTPEAKKLCTQGRVICVSDSVGNSLISNPFRIDVQVNSPDEIFIAWEIRDGTGRMLEANSTYDYTVTEPGRDASIGRMVRVTVFIFATAGAADGTLKLTPSRYTAQTGEVDLDSLTIPIRLNMVTSTVTILEPANPEVFKGAAAEWVEGETHPEFKPTVKLVPRQITILHFDQKDLIGATAEAVLRSWAGQGGWHVTDWQKDGSTAHVTLEGGGWAGVTYYATEVTFLIKQCLLNLPGIKNIVFDR